MAKDSKFKFFRETNVHLAAEFKASWTKLTMISSRRLRIFVVFWTRAGNCIAPPIKCPKTLTVT